MSGAAFKRVVLITLDGVGVGELPDAAKYGDGGAHTLGHVAAACGGLRLPHLQAMGLGNLVDVEGVSPVSRPSAAFGKMAEVSAGKDTTTGHWEIAGIVEPNPLPTYSSGFPAEVIEAFTREVGIEPLGNIGASGTDILVQLGEEHVRSGRPIVYTSADSVFQIAAHEEVIPIERLYDICRIARRILDPYKIGRVIARPFVGSAADGFVRTSRRHDFSLPPTAPTVLDRIEEAGMSVYGVGKIRDIFAGRGITESVYTASNADGMAKTLEALERVERGMIFTNLVDFDMLYGHRLDAAGFGAALEAFDAWLPQLCQRLQPNDLLVLTADHGCDPTTPGSDHSREYVPLLAWHRGMVAGSELGCRQSFADIAATVVDAFSLEPVQGESFLAELLAPSGG